MDSIPVIGEVLDLPGEIPLPEQEISNSSNDGIFSDNYNL
jgi:hypothetical protein